MGSCLLQAIDGLDADVLTIENSRSGNEMIVALAQYGYKKDVGPGVYDVHSPVVPRCVNFWPSTLLYVEYFCLIAYIKPYLINLHVVTLHTSSCMCTLKALQTSVNILMYARCTILSIHMLDFMQ